MPKKVFHVYILSSRSRNLYIGSSGDIITRVWEHKTKARDGYPGHAAVQQSFILDRDQSLDVVLRPLPVPAVADSHSVAPARAPRPLPPRAAAPSAPPLPAAPPVAPAPPPSEPPKSPFKIDRSDPWK